MSPGWTIGVGVAAAVAVAKAFQTPEASPLPHPDPGRARRPLDDALFDMPDRIVEHDITTPDGGSPHVVESERSPRHSPCTASRQRHDVWAPQFYQLTDSYRAI